MAARRNNALGDEVFTDRLFAQGTFKYVYEGMYTRGPRKGQRSIMKVFKDGAVYEDSFFHHELDVVEKAMELIEKFNQEGIIDQPVFLNKPEIWEVASSLSGTWEGQKSLCEPMIKSFHKYNSNTGWHAHSRNSWHQAMQALSHFSYHTTGGAFLLCDLQGGFYRDGVVLTDPAVMSRDQRFGPTDLGPRGISTFFSRHRCNQYCLKGWHKPRDCSSYFPIRRGTWMARGSSDPPPRHGPSRSRSFPALATVKEEA